MLQYLSTQDNKPCQVLFSSGFPFLPDNFYQSYKSWKGEQFRLTYSIYMMSLFKIRMDLNKVNCEKNDFLK